MAIRWGNAIPAGVELLYHLCYGDNAHRHAVEPASLAVAVDFSNAVSAGIGRSIELIHMPVPRERSDDAYFEPLKRLKLRPETRLGLGLIHYTDGVPGTRARIATAEKYAKDFLISTECGFGRRARDTIPDLLRIHAEVAGIG
jgi:methionine synthase II (cobalamin-independent)